MKKLKNTLALTLGSLLYILMWQVLSSFGNHYGHPVINENMLNAFTEGTNYKKIEKLKNFYFDLNETVKGTGITSGGKTSISEGKMELSVKNWIIQGGVYADEPEVMNSLRHFYDPTQPAGSRHLTDQSRGILGYVQSAYGIYDLPKIDGVEWAVANADHEYNWVQGKIALKDAFGATDLSKKKELMAKAWRCLGETMHMVADNATPAHVRDDAHPAPLGDSKSFGDPDTFEEYMDYIAENEKKPGFGYFAKWSKLQADATLTANLNKATTIRELAHTLAVYTNTNFFSGQTIEGNDSQGYTVVSKSKSGKKYPSPKIDKSMYIGTHFEKNGIKLCSQPWWIGIVSNVSDVFIDKPTVESMATKLIPAAMEGGKNAIRLFIPDIKLVITEFKSDGTFKGTVNHTKDAEYTLPIVYNGTINILDKKLNIIEKIEAKDNKFEGKLKDLNIAEISAFFSVAGLDIYSSSIVKSDFEIKWGHIYILGEFDASYIYSGKVPEGFEKTWKGVKVQNLDFNFYLEDNLKESNGNVTGSMGGNPFQIAFDPATNDLKSFNIKRTYTWAVDKFDMDMSAKGGGIPVKYYNNPNLDPASKYMVWTVKGKECQAFIQDAKLYVKQYLPSYEGLIEEKWLSKYQATDNSKIEIYLYYKKK